MTRLNYVCVFCGASTPTHAPHIARIQEFAERLAATGAGLVYGGGRVGLMGLAAERVLARGGRVIGVIPHQLQRRELAFHGLTELHVVDSMHERKRLMYEKSDAFVAFPGGFGTLDEMMEILTWKQLGIHDKPIVFMNVDGYYDHLRGFFERAIEDGLIKSEYVPLFHFTETLDDLFAYLESYEPHKTGIMPWA